MNPWVIHLRPLWDQSIAPAGAPTVLTGDRGVQAEHRIDRFDWKIRTQGQISSAI